MLGAGVVDCGGAVVDQEHEHPVGDSARDLLVGIRHLLRRDAEVGDGRFSTGSGRGEADEVSAEDSSRRAGAIPSLWGSGSAGDLALFFLCLADDLRRRAAGIPRWQFDLGVFSGRISQRPPMVEDGIGEFPVN